MGCGRDVCNWIDNVSRFLTSEDKDLKVLSHMKTRIENSGALIEHRKYQVMRPSRHHTLSVVG